MAQVTVDFIAFDESRDACLMVLIEGPWTKDTTGHLLALQARIYGCLEAALDGQLADQFPRSVGKTIVVSVECTEVPLDEVDAFIRRFATGVSALPDYAVEDSPYVADFRFEVNHLPLSSQDRHAL